MTEGPRELLLRVVNWVAEHAMASLTAIVAAVLLGFVFSAGGTSLSALFWSDDLELVYLVDHPGVRCVQLRGRDQCSASYDVKIGNTGSEHYERVLLELQGVSTGMSHPEVSYRNLGSSNPRAFDPEVSIEIDEDQHVHLFEIRKLAAGTLVTISTVDLSGRTSRELGLLKPGYIIEAEGSLIEGDPEDTVIGRMLQGVFGAFL